MITSTIRVLLSEATLTRNCTSQEPIIFDIDPDESLVPNNFIFRTWAQEKQLVPTSFVVTSKRTTGFGDKSTAQNVAEILNGRQILLLLLWLRSHTKQ